jgi:hypothetical protein
MKVSGIVKGIGVLVLTALLSGLFLAALLLPVFFTWRFVFA